MRKIFLLFLALLSLKLYAQDYGAFSRGDKLVSVGYGLNPGFDRGTLFTASAEQGITKDISAGITVEHLSAKYQTEFKFGVVYLGARGNYHLNNLVKLNNSRADIYAGLTLGYGIFYWKGSDNGLSTSGKYSSGIYLGGLVGGKYYFSEHAGIFLELGASGNSNGRLGLAFRF